MTRILLIGEDLSLLSTRAALLSSLGAEVVSGRTGEAAELLEEQRYELVVLCHTLLDKDAEILSQVAKSRWPGMQILQVVTDQWLDTRKTPGVTAISSAEPRRLMERTNEVLHRIASGAA